jgi:hypothetical protein
LLQFLLVAVAELAEVCIGDSAAEGVHCLFLVVLVAKFVLRSCEGWRARYVGGCDCAWWVFLTYLKLSFVGV